MKGFSRIDIVRIPVVEVKGINSKLQWLSHSLGLFSLRDKEKSCYRIFVELIKASRMDKPLSSDEIAYRLNLTRGTVVYHLNHLMHSGIVILIDGRYVLKKESLAKLIKDIKKEVCRVMDDMENIAGEIDKSL